MNFGIRENNNVLRRLTELNERSKNVNKQWKVVTKEGLFLCIGTLVEATVTLSRFLETFSK